MLQYVFHGILGFQIAFMWLQFLFIRRKEYLFYSLYILCLGVYFQAVTHSLLEPYGLFSGENELLLLLFDQPVVILSHAMYYRFARNFLNIPQLFPKFNHQIRLFEWFLVACAAFLVVGYTSFGKMGLLEICFQVLCVILFFSTVYFQIRFLLIQKTNLNLFILIGASLILVGSFTSFVLAVLENEFGANLPLNPFVPFQIAIILELFVFTSGLGYKTFAIEREKLLKEQQLVKELREKEFLHRNMTELKERISSDLHDDIGASLGSINIFAGVALKNLQSNRTEDSVNHLRRITEVTQEALSNVRNTLWSLNTGQGSLLDFCFKVKDYAQPLLNAKGVHFQLTHSGPCGQLELSVLEKRNLFLILKEAVHNIVKHADCTNVWLEIVCENEDFSITLRDDGQGFSADLESEGLGLKTMKKRAFEIKTGFELTTIPGAGTTICLSKPY